VLVAIDGHVAGLLVMADELRPDAQRVVERLRAEGVRHVAMLSGDRRSMAERVGRELDFDRVYAEQSPADKLEVVTRVADALPAGRRALTIARQSVLIGMGLSLIAMGFAAAGALPPVAGALLQEGIDLGVILNALRAQRG